MAGAVLKEQIEQALLNENLGGALGRFSEAYAVSRAKAYAETDFEALRNKIAGLKEYAAENMEEMAREFTKQAEARGAKVFRARTGEEVKRYIADLAQERGVKKIVKSKSMASEEIHLNQYLEAEGFQVKETDLGEWIIQLAGQRPSHMVMPAIHMTKEEVAGYFSKETGKHLTTDIPQLVKVAREELRRAFLEADLGISGANMAVAETGTLVLVTNEGNARLVTTLPKIHVAIVGLEKLVPRFSDISTILRALPRSATGQTLTSYVSMITGATQTATENGTEPKELHIILMDNGRTKMRQDPVFKQALQCIRCASCLNVCPVYRVVGGHVFGKVYSGGIGTILTAWFDEMKKSEDIQGLCIQCGRCKEICPGKINIPELILELRTRLTRDKGLPMAQKIIFEGVLGNRKLFHSLLRAASIAQKPFTSGQMIRHLPLFFSGLADFRSLPAIADVPFRDRLDNIAQPTKTKKKAAFFGGCLIDFVYPELGEAVVKVLNHEGIEVVFPKGQSCCGAPAKYNGASEAALKMARQNIEALLEEDVDYVVSACPTCTVALKYDFVKAVAGDLEWEAKAKRLSAKVRDFSNLVYELRKEKGEVVPNEGPKFLQVTYHDSCHLKRTLHIAEEPRELLASTRGIQVIEMKESDICCGMGGSYSVKFPELSKPILTRKLQNIQESGAQEVACDCPGCMMQLRGGLDKVGSPVKVKHTAEILADAILTKGAAACGE